MQREEQRDAPKAARVRRLVDVVGVILVIFTVVVFVGIFWRTIVLVEATAREQASSYIDLIVGTRKWNASLGGVWVVKSPTVQTNPYPRSLGVEPDTSTAGGQSLTLRNPAAMTNEIAKLFEESGHARFRLTSLNPINPADTPDPWEREVLQHFKQDQSDVSAIQRVQSGRELRMMRPLLVEESCLRCHAKQGYRVGDVRGAISLILPLKPFDDAIAKDGLALATLLVLTLGIVWGGYAFTSRLVKQVEDAELDLQVLADTDPLTRIANRRTIMQRLEAELARGERESHTTGVLELDVDLFKNINDRYGHAAGDECLKQIVARAAGALRDYDVVGRIGGEEFLVVAPNVTNESFSQLAERLRSAVAARPIEYETDSVSVTISIGATTSQPGDTPDGILIRADRALYAAKDLGRNRVEMG